MARSNVCWGEDREASIAARQAFFWTNIAPQHPRLNREWWLSLENWERNVAVLHSQATGFSGPVFADRDEPFRGEVELEDGLVAYDTFKVPSAYWKVVSVAAAPGGLACAAYLMDQFAMLKRRVGRKFNLSDYLISIPDLEKATKLRFDAVFHQAGRLDPKLA
jgi:endonuclease G